ncbi:MAG: hypothetical protein JRI61_06725 [Deltaproteobacteria bacterium]|nr:hypothetical protein [Deltaproteobacteria bacterium]
MRIRMICMAIAVFVFFLVAVTAAAEDSCDELIAEAEQLWSVNKFEESDKRLDKVIETCPELAEPYWRKGRNILIKLEGIPRDQKPAKKELIMLYSEIETLADKCIEIDENDGHCYFWKGIGMGRRATTQGVLKMLFMAEDVENTWLKASDLGLTYQSEDGTVEAKCLNYYALGMFYRLVPEWLCLFPLKQIVGTCGDKKKSVEYQRKAVACMQNGIGMYKELAVSLLCYGQKYKKPEDVEEAKKILKNLQSMPEKMQFDRIDKEHARMLLADSSLACGYSRDKQQELSEEAYEKAKK